jgi:hypothetical protein
MSPLVLYPDGHLSPLLSMLVCYLLDGAVPAAFALVALASWVSHLVLAMRARAVEQSKGAQAQGRAVIRGVVELAQGAPGAVRVEVEQYGAEFLSKGRWAHKWFETGRRTLAHPFYVREESGRRVRVEPGADVKIIDDLDEVTYGASGVRTRAAAISPGEEAYVWGELGTGADPEQEAGYRESRPAPVLRSPRSGVMLIASQPPAARFRATAFVHGMWFLGFVALLGVLQLFTLYQTIRLVAGETAVGTIVQKRSFTKVKRQQRIWHYEVTTRTPTGVSFVQEVDSVDFERVREGSSVALVFVPGHSGYELLGDRPTVPSDLPIGALLLLGSTAAGYVLHRRSLRPWYERKTVEERNAGRLREGAEPEPQREPVIPGG